MFFGRLVQLKLQGDHDKGIRIWVAKLPCECESADDLSQAATLKVSGFDTGNLFFMAISFVPTKVWYQRCERGDYKLKLGRNKNNHLSRHATECGHPLSGTLSSSLRRFIWRCKNTNQNLIIISTLNHHLCEASDNYITAGKQRRVV